MTHTRHLKVTLLGPLPFGGSLTVALTNPAHDRAVEDALNRGYTVYRLWSFDTDTTGRPLPGTREIH